ncbi:conserved hypothetical protein [Pseudomonas sp. 8Z]|uniref:hypothetical protein n=1 Tax=Pseudomonas sp. 8Z TaxID=2653166 RepID=UPI0012F221E8|nr:hypothetical protein [Pseudomonas sp. 8Z]VXC72557.1 conserved hypothetical protein [Pseudomonas sp. 8Z]
MGLLTELDQVKAVADAVELLDVDVLDFEHLELNSGRDFLLALVTGPHVEKVVELLERLRSRSQPAPAGGAVVAHTNDDQVLHIVELMQEWHSSRVKKLSLVANAGPDVKIEARDPDGKPLELTGQLRAGFQEGVNLALQMFGKFPLTVTEPADELGEEE